MIHGPASSILGIFDETKAREFFYSFLAFKIEFGHRFLPEAPLYMMMFRRRAVWFVSMSTMLNVSTAS